MKSRQFPAERLSPFPCHSSVIPPLISPPSPSSSSLPLAFSFLFLLLSPPLLSPPLLSSSFLPFSLLQVQSESTKNRRMSQKSSDSVNEPDRQLKKLFGAIRDNDINYVSINSTVLPQWYYCTSQHNQLPPLFPSLFPSLLCYTPLSHPFLSSFPSPPPPLQVRYLFGWEEAETLEDKGGGTGGKRLCHPLCQCEKCSRLRQVCKGLGAWLSTRCHLCQVVCKEANPKMANRSCVPTDTRNPHKD